VAVITGGAGHLGGAIARRLAEDGVRLALFDRDSLRLLQAVEGLRAAGATAFGHTLDLADGPELARAVAAVTQDLAAPAILVNCAGISPKREGRPPSVEDIATEEWEEVLRVNLTGAFEAIKAVVPAMKAAGFGRIVNVSSMAARMASPTAGLHYTTSKAAMIGMTRSLGRSLAPHGILVVAVAPGKLRSPGWQDDEALVQRYTESIPLGRLAEAGEVAELVAFLCSDRNTYVTGTTVEVDGGRAP
jgi:NAD(P)-dependent dehydrogenase (short-subunit alcohol dehydrogenase family)